MNRGGAEARSQLIHQSLTEQIIGAAIEVHRTLGPGLLESAYEECLCHELRLRGVPFQRQVELPVEYKGIKLDCGYRMDLLVAEAVVVELKCVDRFANEHVVLMHVSQLYRPDEVAGVLDRRVPPILRKKLIPFVPDGPSWPG